MIIYSLNLIKTMKFGYNIIVFLAIFLFAPFFASAYQINKVPIRAGDNFSVYPNRFDLELKPGQQDIKEVVITNNSDKKLSFELIVEDFIGSNNPEEKIKFLGEKSSNKFSLKDCIKPEISDFTLGAGEQILLNTEISLSVDLKTENGLYAALMIGAKLADSESAISSFSRIATLFLISPVLEKKQETFKPNFDFIQTDKNNPPQFKLTADNAGQYHLAVLGNAKITDWRDKEIEKIDLDFWYILPQSKAEKVVAVAQRLAFGKYKAEAELVWKNPVSGAEEKEIKSINFWVFPQQAMIFSIFALIIISCLLLFIFGWKIAKRFLIIFLVLNFAFITQSIYAALQSENYKIMKDALIIGGSESGGSANYIMKNTAGEPVAGRLSDSAYNLKSGFRVPDAYTISISTPSDIAMSGCRQGLACVSTGTVSWTVTTNSPNGYTLSLSAATDPALKSGSNSFADLSISPSFWSVDSKASAFGFAVGATGQTGIATGFKDNGTTCGTGSNIGSCYRGFDGTTSIQIVNFSAQAVSGNATDVKLKAEVGINYGQAIGAYTATITATAAAL